MTTATPSRPVSPGTGGPRRSPGLGPGPAPTSASVDPFRVIRKHLLLIVASMFIGGGLGVGAHFAFAAFAPQYSGEVLFQVLPPVVEANQVTASTQMAAEDIRIKAETELEMALQTETIKDALGKRDVRETQWWKETYGAEVPSDKIANELIDELRPGIVRGTVLFRIAWTSGYRESVPVVLNAVAESHIAANRKRDKERYDATKSRFETQRTQTQDEIRKRELDRKDFIRENTILTLEDPRFNDVMESIKNLNQQRSETESQLVSADERIRTLNAKLDGNLVYSQEDEQRADLDTSVAGQINRVELLKGQLEEARRKFAGEDVPQVRNIRNELESAEGVLDNRRRAVIIRNLNAELLDAQSFRRQAAAVLDQVDEQLRAKQDQQQELSQKFADFQSLQREIDGLQEQASNDRQMLNELNLLQAREDASKAQIAVRAETPDSRSFPKLLVMVPLGVLLVTGLVTGLVFLREITDRRVRTASDLEIIPGATVLGVVPEAAEDPTRCREPELAVWAAPTSVMAESYRQIAGPLLRTLGTYDLRSMVFAGGMPRAGTTSLISNLGASAAAAGMRVVVVDANFRRPRLATIMGGDDAAPGLGDLLTGGAQLQDVVHRHECGCAWIGAGTPEARIVERLGTVAIDRLLAQLTTQFDLIIFDAPPAVVAGDALALAGRVDAAALVVQAGEEERGLVGRMVRQFAGATRVVGIVLNRPRGTAGGYFRKNFAVMANYARARK